MAGGGEKIKTDRGGGGGGRRCEERREREKRGAGREGRW